MVGLRWLTNRDSGEFRGCGFVEFSNSEEADKAMLLDGAELLGGLSAWIGRCKEEKNADLNFTLESVIVEQDIYTSNYLSPKGRIKSR